MIRALALLSVLLVGNVANAATVTFTSTSGFSLLAGPDVLGIAGLQFAALINTTSATTSSGSHISFAPAAPISFALGSGTVTTGGATSSFSNIAAAGGLLSFNNINVSLPSNFTQDQWNDAVDSFPSPGGAAFWVIGATIYGASIQAVPEPSSALALAGIAVGICGFSRRRRTV